jgi:hypothetical protein
VSGRPLDGELLLELCRGYATAINEGRVPSVDSAWACLCRAEGVKALREAEELLDRKTAELRKEHCLAQDQLNDLKAVVSASTTILISS